MKNGFIPFFYGFAHGATFSCSSDLSIEIVEICEKYNIWMNIDAAYLGATWLCPEYRVDQNIIEKVDSICLNFAKAMHMGNGGSFMFIKNKK